MIMLNACIVMSGTAYHYQLNLGFSVKVHATSGVIYRVAGWQLLAEILWVNFIGNCSYTYWQISYTKFTHDGPVYAYQQALKYLGVRYVNSTGDMKAKFLGIAEPTRRGVDGATGAIKTILDASKWSFASAIKVMTGFTSLWRSKLIG